jgi:hypothetical protein
VDFLRQNIIHSIYRYGVEALIIGYRLGLSIYEVNSTMKFNHLTKLGFQLTVCRKRVAR